APSPGSIWICRAGRASTCERSARQLRMGCWTARRCALWTRPGHPARAAGQGTRPVRCRAGRGPWRERPDALPCHERRLDAEITDQYGPGRTLADVSQAWRPYRTWAAVHLRALREQRTGEIAGRCGGSEFPAARAARITVATMAARTITCGSC